MKYISMLPVIVVMLFATSCNKLKHIPFDYIYHTSANIPASPTPLPGATVTVPLTVRTNIDSVLQAKGTKPDLLESAKLGALTLTITAPPGGNFALLKDIQIYVVTPTGNMLVASKHNISTTSSTLDLDVENVELKPYLTAETMTLQATITTATGVTTDMTINFDMKVHFEANLLAAL